MSRFFPLLKISSWLTMLAIALVPTATIVLLGLDVAHESRVAALLLAVFGTYGLLALVLGLVLAPWWLLAVAAIRRDRSRPSRVEARHA
jgi:hypothetical protein